MPAGATRSLFLFAIPQKKEKRDISFENEEGQKGNARNCLYSEKAECLHGNIGGLEEHGMPKVLNRSGCGLATP